jgi:hypothetical protein
MPLKGKNKNPSHVIGWREWISFPDFSELKTKVKIDTGARTSCLHATHVTLSKRGGKDWARFYYYPLQDSTKVKVEAVALIEGYRKIKSSNGQSQLRPVVNTSILLGKKLWQIELTLTDRDFMGFRMLLGRKAIKDGRFLVDVSQSFIESEE